MNIEIYPTHPDFGGKYMKHCIQPAGNDIPEWYKTSNGYFGNQQDKKFLEKRMTIKKCIPVFDYLNTGINLYLPFSIFAYGKYPERTLNTNAHHNGLCGLGSHNRDQVQSFPLPDSYDPQPRKIEFPFLIKTPKNYSTIYVQPINEFYDTWLFPRALVNTDNYDNQVNFPLFLKKDFEGTIPAGTHFMTLFFIKRENVDLKMNNFEDGKDMISQTRTMVVNWGKNFYKNTRF